MLCAYYSTQTTNKLVLTGVKFMFSKKAPKIDEIFTVDSTLTTLDSGIDVAPGINVAPTS